MGRSLWESNEDDELEEEFGSIVESDKEFWAACGGVGRRGPGNMIGLDRVEATGASNREEYGKWNSLKTTYDLI